MDEDEFIFAWKTVARDGKVCETGLKNFMSEVAGVSMSVSQIRDLMHYMDANGDGVVSRDDFRMFLEAGALEDIGPKEFMWEPHRKYRARSPQSKGSRVFIEKDKAETEKPPSTPANDRIERAVANYERETWQRLLREEAAVIPNLFARYDKQGKGELDAASFHAMLSQWYDVASFAHCGSLRPADSLAVVAYLRERQAAEGDRSGAGGDTTLPYDLWKAVVDGKFKPVDHLAGGK
mmetsp:Transcript_30698/g.73587  ORF Transcript_30698/g.73587 Transcript_30698/m.73587 type:complete len:236 (+) Transcript_30698:13-720(+)